MVIPRVQRNDNPTTLHTITAAIDQAGCCVVEDAIQNETAQAIPRELVAFDSAGSIRASAFEGHATRRTGAAPHARRPSARSAMHPTVMCAGGHVLGPTTGWRFSASEFIQIGPGETAQRLHRDQWKDGVVDFPNEIELNGMWAISDFTAANSATRIIPGSHRDGNAEPRGADARPCRDGGRVTLAVHGQAVSRRRGQYERRMASWTLVAARGELADAIKQPIS